MKKIPFLLMAFLLMACGPSDRQKSGGKAQASSRDSAAFSSADGFQGTLVIPPQYLNTVTLSMGGIVKTLSLTPGESVRKGAVLGTVENPAFIDLQQAYLDSRAQLDYLEAEYRRQQNLSREEVASQKELQQSKADFLSMKSRVEASAEQLRQLGVNPEKLAEDGIVPYITVRAPAGGYVSNVQVNVGKYLNTGDPLCDIVDKDRMQLRLIAYEEDLARLKPESEFTFRVNGLGKKKFRATLISVGQQVDENDRTIELYARIADLDPHFRPGMRVSAKIKR